MASKKERNSRLTARTRQPLVEQVEQAPAEKGCSVTETSALVELSGRDAAFIADLLDNPPEPSAALRRAAKRHAAECRDKCGIEQCLEVARRHGVASGPDHEIGDLQAFLFAAWSLLTPDQRTAFARSKAVILTLEGAPTP